MAETIDAGHVKVWLEGEKLWGGWTLQRTRRSPKPQWLAIKRRDEGADPGRNPPSTEPEWVRTGRTVEQVAREEDEDCPRRRPRRSPWPRSRRRRGSGCARPPRRSMPR